MCKKNCDSLSAYESRTLQKDLRIKLEEAYKIIGAEAKDKAALRAENFSLSKDLDDARANVKRILCLREQIDGANKLIVDLTGMLTKARHIIRRLRGETLTRRDGGKDRHHQTRDTP